LGPLASASRQVGPNGDTTRGTLLNTTKRHRCRQNVGNISERRVLTSSACVSHFEAMWAEVAPKRVQLQPNCDSDMLEPSWAEVGALLSEVDPKEPMWRPGRIETVHLAECWADLQNAQSTTAGNRLLANKGPPQLKLYQSDRSVRSHPLLNYHALAPSVRADLYSHAITINYITQNKSALCTCIA